MLKLTPQQVAQVAKLTDQTLRHWRQVLPPLGGMNGYTPCFAPGDVLAILVVRHLVKVMGLGVSSLASASTGLFALCRDTSWPELAHVQLLIQVEDGNVNVLTSDVNIESPAIVVPMRRFADELQAAWANNSLTPVEQLPLHFQAPVGPSRVSSAGVLLTLT
jgi:hypothetical protein